MLPVRIYGEGDVAFDPLGGTEPCSNGRAFAEIFRVTEHRRAGRFGDFGRGVGRAIVDDQDGHMVAELFAQARHDIPNRSGRVEGGDEDTGAHQSKLLAPVFS
jgi:hypothetical protein